MSSKSGSFVRGLPPPEPLECNDYMEHFMEEVNKFTVFHGGIPIQDLEPQLVNEGDYMLRNPPEPGNTTRLILTVRHKVPVPSIIDVPLTAGYEDGKPFITMNGELKKPTLRELLVDYLKEKIPVHETKEGHKVVLIKGIVRASWELPKHSVALETKLGEGAFGTVWKGTLKDDKGEAKAVAVKVTKVCEDNKLQTTEILSEARMMRQLNHPNVVAFYGMVVNHEQVMIVMELIQGGSLDKVLKEKEVPIEEKCDYCVHIASGMAYLHHNGFMHRDMAGFSEFHLLKHLQAARNCLLDEAAKIVKISDFGMSKQGETYKMDPTERTPIRWQAPELMRTAVYTRACDVYSFGMTLYEIFSDGKMPFHGIENAEIRKKIHDPKFRPKLPANTPQGLQQIISLTWLANPEKRPSMKDCVLLLKKHAAQRKYMMDQKKKKVLHAIQNTKSVSKSTTSGTGGQQVARSPNKSNDRVARPKATRGSKEGKGEKKTGGSGKDKDPKKKKKKENKPAGGSGKAKKVAKSKDSASDKPSGKKNKKK